MNIEVSGRKYEVTDKVRKMIEQKLEKVKKYFHDIIEIRCVLKVEKYRNICEVQIHGKEHDVASRQEGETMEEAIQMAIDHLKLQAQKNRTKISDRRKGRAAGAVPATDWQVQVFEAGKFREADNRPRIVTTTKLPVRPLSIEQAVLLLDGSKNDFMVFRDLDTDKVSVIYRRKDKNFGLIAPEF
ncbi:MAG: ribosome hibernation-promoting factor, HPF/YfiA family [Thermoanaerobaculia bacterium]